MFLLCSDGLTSMVPEARVAELLRGADSLQAAAATLVHAANDAGGRDNITVVLFRVEEVGVGATADDRTLAGAAAPSTAEVRAAVESAAGAAPPARRASASRRPRPGRRARRARSTPTPRRAGGAAAGSPSCSPRSC